MLIFSSASLIYSVTLSLFWDEVKIKSTSYFWFDYNSIIFHDSSRQWN